MTVLAIVCGYLALLIVLGAVSSMFFRGTSRDYFVASHSIGSFLLLMSIFGTTMTSFALVGSTGEAYERGIGVYGLMASWSGLVHSAIFFLVGIRLWAIGRRHGFVTQCQFFRARFDSDGLGYLLFPLLVALVIPYLLIGLLGATAVVKGVTAGLFPETFFVGDPKVAGAVPPWLSGGVICLVVLTYVFFGGLRGAAWANAFQTCVFMTTGIVALWMISDQLGGAAAASRRVLEVAPRLAAREGSIGQLEFLTYFFVPFSVAMFPHLFQHWLTAKSARTFRLTVIAHPIFIMIVWAPCILIGIWAAGAGVKAPHPNQVLGIMVNNIHSDLLTGLLTAGILAAIMSSLDSQFMCIGTMFTNDIVVHSVGEKRFSDTQKVWIARGFVVFIVLVTYLLSLFEPRRVFSLGVWAFSGFGGLSPLVFAALYWRRATKAGAYACIVTTAAVWLLLFARAGWGLHESLVFGMMPAAYIFAASLVSLVIVSLLTQPPPKHLVDRFFIHPSPAPTR